MKRIIVSGLLGIQAVTVLAQVIAADEPRAGTREYYSKYIEGRYRYQNGAMVPIVTGAMTAVSRPTTTPQPLSGTIVQVAGTNEVIVRTSRRMPSGAKKPEYAVLRLRTLDGVSVEQVIATNVVQDGSYRCVLASGMTNILAGFRVHENPSTITYDEYLEVFKRDSQVEPIGEVTRIERVSGPPVASYNARLQQRRQAGQSSLTGEALQKYLQDYQLDLIRKGQPALPIPLTKEMDDQLVKEGVLAPAVPPPARKANQTSQAIDAVTAPQPEH